MADKDRPGPGPRCGPASDPEAPAGTVSDQIARLAALVDQYRDNDLRIKGILDTLVDAVVTIDTAGIVESSNPAVETLFGYSADELVGQNVRLLMPDADAVEHDARIGNYLSTGESKILGSGRGREVEGRHKDGHILPIHLTISEMRVGDDVKFTGILRDISDLKEKEAELAVQVAELESARDRLEDQSRELVELADSLSLSRDEAEGANRAKSEFLAHMSHELRSPLNAVLGFAEIMMEEMLGPIGNERYKGYAGDIHASGSHLLDLINDILDLAKIEAGKLELVEADFDVADAVAASLRLTKERAHKNGVAQVAEIESNLPLLHADERKFKQILINLLSNGVKFTPPGGRLSVRAFLDAGGAMVVVVADTGIGMAPEDIPKALSEFGQVGKASGSQGTGLGLPLTKALTELHGAGFSLESEPGVGTTVTLRFPPERVRAAAA